MQSRYIYILRMTEAERVRFSFDNKPIKLHPFYSIFKAVNQKGEACLAKLFQKDSIDQYELEEVLKFNTQIINESPTFVYPQTILHQHVFQRNQNFYFITKTYQCRLDQFLHKNPQRQKQALRIFQSIFKAVYSLYMQGYWHRNLRAQHFVKYGQQWKLQSFVFSLDQKDSEIHSQYTHQLSTRPPEAYEREEFTEQELDERIVWDLGCVLIHILTGSHKLKDRKTLQKFKNEQFSFTKIGINVGQQISTKLKIMLGQMCHYNMHHRIKYIELVEQGIFSTQIADNYRKNKNKRKTSVISSKSSLSQQIKKYQKINETQFFDHQFNGQKNQVQQSSANEDFKDEKLGAIKQVVVEDINEEQSTSSNIKKNSNTSQQKLKLKIQIDKFMDLYKNQLDKAEILNSALGRVRSIANYFRVEQKRKGQDLINLTSYAINFVRSLFLNQINKSINDNKPFFQIKPDVWQVFHKKYQFKALKQLTKIRIKQSLEATQKLRRKIIDGNNSYLADKHHVKQFVTIRKPTQSKFQEIEQPYRKVIKLAYDVVALRYSEQKNQQEARLAFVLTYCLAVDKLYHPQEFENNFKLYFKWKNSKPSSYISLYDFEQYLNFATRRELVTNSVYIIKKYFEV